MNSTRQTEKVLQGLDPLAAAGVIAAATDFSVLMNSEGVIQDLRIPNDQIPFSNADSWVGKHWADVVTSESRVKVNELIREASSQTLGRWRHVNFPSTQTADVPMLCSAIAVGSQGHVVAYGRDLRSMASLQQRLIEAHQAMERDYLRMRHMETRYRLLFELAAEAVLIVDTATQKVQEANPAAGRILGIAVKKIIGKPLVECIAESHRPAIEDMLSGVRSFGEADSRTISGLSEEGDITVSASLFRQEGGALFLIRLTPAVFQETAQSVSPKKSIAIDVLEHSPDGFVVTDLDGKVISCNHAFVEMAQLTKAEQIVGRNLSDWLGRADVDLNVLIANIQQRGAVRLFATVLHGNSGTDQQVEISGVSVKTSHAPVLGFSIREVGQRLGRDGPRLQELPRSADQLVELVGRVPLQEIVSETADLIEKLCIEAALRLTRDNRASAAEMLGLSRQSLYVKLRRYGIGEVTDRGKK
jgi:transcriptional regulator PpsR